MSELLWSLFLAAVFMPFFSTLSCGLADVVVDLVRRAAGLEKSDD